MSREERDEERKRAVRRNERIQMAIPLLLLGLLGVLIGIGTGGTMMPFCGYPGLAGMAVAFFLILSVGLSRR